MQHGRNERVVGLNVDHDGFTGRQQSAKQLEGLQSIMRKNVELVDGGLVLPGTPNRHRAVTDRSAVSGEHILSSPSWSTVNRIVDDLATHLKSIQLAPGKNVAQTDRARRKFHAWR